MIEDVTKLPSLDYLRKLPDWISVRCGDGIFCLVVTLPNGHVLHCDCNPISLEDLTHPNRIVAPMLSNLLGQINFQKHGDKMIAVHRVVAKAVAAGETPPEEFREVYTDNFNAHNLVAEICGGDKLRVSPQDLWSGALGAP